MKGQYFTDSLLQNQDITVYPNPITNGRCTVKSESEIEFIDVFDSGGNRVFRSYSTEINFTNYASGIYQLGIKTKTGIMYKKVLNY